MPVGKLEDLIVSASLCTIHPGVPEEEGHVLLRALELEKPKAIKRDDYYVATLSELGLICPGKSEKEAVDNLRLTTFSLLRRMAQKGVLEARMKEKGVRVVFMDLPEVIRADHQIIPIQEEV